MNQPSGAIYMYSKCVSQFNSRNLKNTCNCTHMIGYLLLAFVAIYARKYVKKIMLNEFAVGRITVLHSEGSYFHKCYGADKLCKEDAIFITV